MPHDVFLSHAAENKPVADAVCAALEQAGVRCWIAPRDIRAGADWGEAIVQAISRSRAFVLIFSSDANASRQVPREVERAIEYGVPIVPFRIEDVQPRGSLEYQLATVHWLDALSPPLEAHIRKLTATLTGLLGDGSTDEQSQAVNRLSRRAPTAPASRRRVAAVAGAAAAVVAAGIAAYFWLRPPDASSAAAGTSAPSAMAATEGPGTSPAFPVGSPSEPAVSTPGSSVSTSNAPGPVERPSPMPTRSTSTERNAARPGAAPVADANLERFKQMARTNGALTCDGFYCRLNGFRAFATAVSRVWVGERPDQLTRSIVVASSERAFTGSGQADLGSIAYRPGATEMYSRVEFVDGTTTAVIPAQFTGNGTSVAGARLSPSDPSAPALFVGYRHGTDSLLFVPDVPPGTTAVMYSLDREGTTFRRARPVGGGGFQFEGPVADVFVRVRHVRDDGTENGPFLYVAGETAELVVRVGRENLEYLRSPTATPPISCKRLSFDWPMRATTGLQGQALARARSAAARAERYLRDLPFVTRAPVVACVALAPGRTRSWGDWAAVRSVDHRVAGELSTTTRVQVEWQKALDRRFGQSPSDASGIWHAVLPATATDVRVQFAFTDGTSSADLRVPVEDVRPETP